MMILIFNFLMILTLLGLVVFSLRRLLFVFTTAVSRLDWEINTRSSYRPFVTILIPCHNEESVIAKTLDALLKLEYPKDSLEIVVIDDFSSDGTLKIAQSYEKKYSLIHTYKRSQNDKIRGKAAALNEAISKFSQAEILYFLDADHVIRPDALIRLIRHFSDNKVGAVSGRCIPWNRHDSIVSSYVYVESLVHHRITMYASDRLGLAPSILGSNFCIRKSLLEKVGYLDERSLTEDLTLTSCIYELGYIIKYDVTSVSTHEAPDCIKSYFYQHLRWNRGYNQVARSHWKPIIRNKKIPFSRRIELFLSSLGYLDRLFFFGALSLTLVSLFVFPAFHFPFWVWIFFLGIPFFGIVVGLLVEKEKIPMYFRLPLILSMFSLDIFIAMKAYYQDFTKKPTHWYKTLRAGDKVDTSKQDEVS